jgi:hypothetical protein
VEPLADARGSETSQATPPEPESPEPSRDREGAVAEETETAAEPLADARGSELTPDAPAEPAPPVAEPPVAGEPAPPVEEPPPSADEEDITEQSETAAEESAEPEPVEAGPQGWWMLSLFSPGAADQVDWTRGRYTLVVRSGRIESAARHGDLKTPASMILEGSVLVAEGEPHGSARDVAPEGFPHPVYRAGFALAIPIPLRGTP